MYVNIENLGFQYTKKEPLIEGFNLHIEKGEIVSLLGGSGSGKSTILRLIAGLEIPYVGNITVNDVTLTSPSKHVKPEDRQIGMVFQDYALFPHMNVRKNILYGIKHLDKSEQEIRLNEVLKLVELEHKIDSYPHELSGGEQQRIALARSLATKPDLLLLDEPFSNLDTDLKKHIRMTLKQIINAANITCLFVTHDIDDANTIADKIVRM